MPDRTETLYNFPDISGAQYGAFRQDLAFYRRIAEDHGGPVLEIGCGTGRITVELARAGARVIGVDRSSAMLQQARHRIEEARVGDRVELIEADMRRLPQLGAVPPGAFAVAVAPFNTLMHAHTLEDQDLTLRGMFDALAPGGVFGCDVYVPRFGPQHVMRAEPTWRSVMGTEADLFLIQEHDPAQQLIATTYLIDQCDASGHVFRRRARLVQRYYHRFELERAVRAAGFEVLDVYGSFERAPVRDASDVIALLARKPGG
jgi:SAM-dependent methyltransferase